MNDHLAAGSVSKPRQLPRQLTRAREAHFREEVEVILVDGNEPWLLFAEHAGKADGLMQHRVEHGYRKAGLLQCARRVERAQGWVRLHFTYLLGVIRQVIGVRQNDIRHQSIPA